MEQKSIPVLVKILDINDNKPQFQKDEYSVSVSEVSDFVMTPVQSSSCNYGIQQPA